MSELSEGAFTYKQRELYEAMSDVSEISYCAGWCSGNEEAVWRLIHRGGSYGMVSWEVGAHELERVRRAMRAADAWIVWDGNAGPRVVPLAEWREGHPIEETSE